MRLRDRVCVVTGGSQGIGEAICRRFAAEGATVSVWDVDGARGAELAAVLGGSCERCDLASRGEVERACERTLAGHGRIDVLVNNAGIARVGPSESLSDDDWQASIGVMQTGVFLCSQVVGRGMLARGSGSIVNISSINAWEASRSVSRTARRRPRSSR